MQFANYGNGEFLNAAMLVNAEALTQQNFAQIGQMLHTPGVIGAGLTYSIAGLVVTFVLPAPFGVIVSALPEMDALAYWLVVVAELTH